MALTSRTSKSWATRLRMIDAVTLTARSIEDFEPVAAVGDPPVVDEQRAARLPLLLLAAHHQLTGAGAGRPVDAAQVVAEAVLPDRDVGAAAAEQVAGAVVAGAGPPAGERRSGAGARCAASPGSWRWRAAPGRGRPCRAGRRPARASVRRGSGHGSRCGSRSGAASWCPAAIGSTTNRGDGPSAGARSSSSSSVPVRRQALLPISTSTWAVSPASTWSALTLRRTHTVRSVRRSSSQATGGIEQRRAARSGRSRAHRSGCRR